MSLSAAVNQLFRLRDAAASANAIHDEESLYDSKLVELFSINHRLWYLYSIKESLHSPASYVSYAIHMTSSVRIAYWINKIHPKRSDV
uniref:SFRICE_009487 n=1 Tax=Spodoptera frugiperda TaxID=7108 RepID=A0A2H1VIS6_SPOFR